MRGPPRDAGPANAVLGALGVLGGKTSQDTDQRERDDQRSTVTVLSPVEIKSLLSAGIR
jgi:hypothetical protein